MVSFKYRPIKYNYSSRRGNAVKFIVIHDTANKNAGANAYNHYRYFGGKNRNASAHYFVDDKEIVQIVGDSKAAWHCGDNQGYGRALNGATNLNSIGVELCVNKDGDYDKALFNLVELVKNLMKKFKIPLERVCRHYDVTRKNCPSTFTTDDWVRFKKRLGNDILIKFDLERDSEGIYIKKQKQNEFKGDKEILTEIIQSNDLFILKTTSSNIYQQFVGGKTLRQLGAYGINGSFFNTNKPYDTKSVWSIAINNYKPIGENADRVSYDPDIYRGTLAIYEDGRCEVKSVNNITEIRGAKVAVSGLTLIPLYDPVEERIAKDILRNTHHTAIAYKDTDVFLIATKKRMHMSEFKDTIKRIINPDGAIALDGGGSTEFYYKGLYKGSGRPLASIIGIKEV